MLNAFEKSCEYVNKLIDKDSIVYSAVVTTFKQTKITDVALKFLSKEDFTGKDRR